MQTAREIDRELARWQVRRTIARIRKDRDGLAIAKDKVKELIALHKAALSGIK